MNITKVLNKVHYTEDSTIGNPNFLHRYGNQLVPSINFSSANSFYSNQELINYHNDKYKSIRYNRDSNESAIQVETYFKTIFNKSYSLVFDSGMRAITVSINSFLHEVDKIFLPREVYRKTRDYCDYLKLIGAISELIIYENDTMDLDGVDEKSLLFIESFSNPHLMTADFDVIKQCKEKFKCKTILDSTFAGLLNSKVTLDFIDIELQSLTKYVGGYNDIIAGVIATNETETFKRSWDIRSREGGVLDSMSSYLLIRSLRDYDLRVEKQKYNIDKIYRFLEKHHSVERIFLPGKQSSNAQNELFEKFYFYSGSVISFVVNFDVNLLVDKMKGFKSTKIAPSFGSIDSLIEIPSIMSHFGKDDEYYEKIKLERNLIRLSVGCEPFEMIINDLEQILN